MAQRYTKVIESYCTAKGYQIPSGFYRHPASRYAIVNFRTNPPKLVAKTWFNKEDVAYYINNSDSPEKLKVYDFHENHELMFKGGNRFGEGDAL